MSLDPLSGMDSEVRIVREPPSCWRMGGGVVRGLGSGSLWPVDACDLLERETDVEIVNNEAGSSAVSVASSPGWLAGRVYAEEFVCARLVRWCRMLDA